MYKLEIVEIDDALGIVLPDDLLAQLKLAAGMTMIARPDANGFALVRSSDETETNPD